jgi:probable addiction module antidote protein
MTKIKFEDWNPSDDIETKEDVIAILDAALEENDPEFLLSVIEDIARSKGITDLAKGEDRKGVNTVFSPEGSKTFSSMVNVLDKLGCRLSVELKKAS